MYVLRSGTDAFLAALSQTWTAIFGAIPTILAAIVFLIVGLLVARALEFAIVKTIGFVKLDSLLRRMGVDRVVERAGLALNSGKFLGKLVWWVMVFVLITVIADMLGLVTLSGFIVTALGWVFTKLIAAVLILFVAAVIAQFARRTVNASVLSAKLHSASFLGTLAWWAIMVFGLLSALGQIGIDTSLLQNALMSFLMVVPIAVGVAFGLAFGLGGKKRAEELLDRMMDKMGK